MTQITFHILAAIAALVALPIVLFVYAMYGLAFFICHLPGYLRVVVIVPCFIRYVFIMGHNEVYRWLEDRYG